MTAPPGWMMPDFDPSKAKVAELRSILLENNIAHSLSRKSEMVDLYERKVRPKTKALREAYLAVKPSAAGIVDVATGQPIAPSPSKKRVRKPAPAAGRGDDPMDVDGPVVPAPRPRGRPRKIKSVPEELPGRGGSLYDSDEEEFAVTAAQPAKKKPRQSRRGAPVVVVPGSASKDGTRHLPWAKEDEEDEMDLLAAVDERVQAAAARKSTASASVKRKKSVEPVAEPEDRREQDEDEIAERARELQRQMGSKKRRKESRRSSGMYESGPDSGFSDFNPFQSDESPEPKEKKPRRKSEAASRRESFTAAGMLPKSIAIADLASPNPFPPAGRLLHGRSSLGTPLHSSSPARATPGSAAGRQSLPVGLSTNKQVPYLQHSMAPFTLPSFSTPDQIARQLIPNPAFEAADGDDDHCSKEESPDSGNLSMGSSPTGKEDPRTLERIPEGSGGAPAPRKYRPSLSEMAHQARPSTVPPKSVLKPRPGTASAGLEKWVPFRGARDGNRNTILAAGELAVLILAAATLTWWRSYKLSLGFCDTASASNALTRDRAAEVYTLYSENSPVHGLYNFLEHTGLLPGCAPCPTHATCVGTKLQACHRDYVLRESWLSLGGVLPVAPTCVPDTEKLIKVAEEAAGIVRALRRRRGEVICQGEWSGRSSAAEEEWRVYGLPEGELRRRAATQRASSYGDLFAMALEDLESHGEVCAGVNGGGEKWFVSPTAEVGLLCQAKLAALDWAARQKKWLALLVALVAGYFWTVRKVRSAKAQAEEVRGLVEMVYEKLRDQSRMHYTDPVTTPDPYLAPAHLRDFILASEFSISARKLLWKHVEKVVEGNANVRVRQAEHRGETIRVWEWVGSYSVDISPRKSMGGGGAPGTGRRHVSFGEPNDSAPSTPLYPALKR